MATSRLSLLAAGCAALAGIASAGTLYLPAYPASVLVFDEAKGQIVDRIPLETGTPMSIRLSPDHKKIYVTTIDHNGIEVIDVARRTNNIAYLKARPIPRASCFTRSPRKSLNFPNTSMSPSRNTPSSTWNSRRS